jgi:hypothetical protein
MRALGIFVAVSPLLAAGSLHAAGRVEMVLAADSKSALTHQQWLRVLTQLKVTGLSIRGVRPGDAPKIETAGTASQPVYRVTGLINERSELVVPGGRFSLSNTSALAGWLAKLAEQGPPGAPGAGGPGSPFGLDEASLKRVQAQLRVSVDFSTLEMNTPEAVTRIRQKLGLPLAMEPGSEAALRGAGKVRDELQGLAAGTALAALVRPAGLALAPRKDRQGGLELVIRKAAAGDVWPVGLSAEDERQQVLPALFESITVGIEENPLPDAVAAVCGRLQIPYLVDHNALAVQGTDFQKAVVSLPESKLTYSLILRKLLGQAGLVNQLRTDEAGKPFLWITTVRAAPR